MMKQNGNTSEQSERGLLPYVVIVAATKGDPEAMKMVVQHYALPVFLPFLAIRFTSCSSWDCRTRAE